VSEAETPAKWITPKKYIDQCDCPQSTHRFGAGVFSIDVALIATTHNPKKFARTLGQAAIELGSNKCL
jgi:hypothetical protein